MEAIINKTKEDAAGKEAKCDRKVVMHIDKDSTLQMKTYIKQLENEVVLLKQLLADLKEMEHPAVSKAECYWKQKVKGDEHCHEKQMRDLEDVAAKKVDLTNLQEMVLFWSCIKQLLETCRK